MNWKLLALQNPVRAEPLSSLVNRRNNNLRCWFEQRLLDLAESLIAAARASKMAWAAILPIFSWDMLWVLIAGGIISMWLLL